MTARAPTATAPTGTAAVTTPALQANKPARANAESSGEVEPPERAQVPPDLQMRPEIRHDGLGRQPRELVAATAGHRLATTVLLDRGTALGAAPPTPTASGARELPLRIPCRAGAGGAGAFVVPASKSPPTPSNTSRVNGSRHNGHDGPRAAGRQARAQVCKQPAQNSWPQRSE
eukprot:CAMPEP_0170302820 /NCGR_PEP_ID=MMETSP0116_2-20130129/51709_1 /TAXON_ID=400756 /ORGANISM="Durinskia baltica, Strain CSIRO CS-38" /LENGTH=173 /DNA_ID=CAMNT_0010554721 /DNA_START=215 /DNA_END=732 /DNA_ORIENTATION=+